MEFRNLEINDYYRGYLDLLSQLTEVNKENITFEKVFKLYQKFEVTVIK